MKYETTQKRLARLDLAIAVWEQRVLNAPSIEVGRRHHEKLDALREKRRRVLGVVS